MLLFIKTVVLGITTYSSVTVVTGYTRSQYIVTLKTWKQATQMVRMMTVVARHFLPSVVTFTPARLSYLNHPKTLITNGNNHY